MSGAPLPPGPLPATSPVSQSAATTALALLGSAEVVTLPGRLTPLSRTIALPAQVAEMAANGLIQLKTPAGFLTLRNGPALSAGQSLMLRLTPGESIAVLYGAGAGPGGGTLAAPSSLAAAGAPLSPAVGNSGLTALPTAGAVLPALLFGAGMGAGGLRAEASLATAFGSGHGNLPASGTGGIGGAAAGLAPGQAAGAQENGSLNRNPEGRGVSGSGGLVAAGPGSGDPSRMASGQMTPSERLQAQAVQAGSVPGSSAATRGERAAGRDSGQPVALRILASAAPGNPLPALAAGRTGAPALTGTVSGQTAQGETVLTAASHRFVLRSGGLLPPGTQIAFTVEDPQAALETRPGSRAGGETTASGALRQILSALATADPAAARSLLNTVIPQPNRRLGAALAFFLAATRNGDSSGWLGEAASRALEKDGRQSLLELFREDFQANSRAFTESQAGEWKPVLIPFLEGDALARLACHIRAVGDEESAAGKSSREPAGQRFLIDLDLSRFGPLQLDGLVRPQRFDLIIRSQDSLPADVRAELPGLFTTCLEAVGFAGSLAFQTGRRGWVHPAAAAPAAVRPVGLEI